MEFRKGAGVGGIVSGASDTGPKPPVGAHKPTSSDEPEDLSDEQRAELRALLETKRDELRASIEARTGQERGIERDVGDEMDEANIEEETAMASRLLERDVQLLREIDRALAKFRDGTYGACEGTDEPIGYGRLRSRPWARFSVEYQEQLEREARTRGGF